MQKNSSSCASVQGNDPTDIKTKVFGLFHMKILGGWTHYVVLKVLPEVKHWHVGWIVEANNDRIIQLNKLSLSQSCVKMLTGPKGQLTTFFALTDTGRQISIVIVDYGTFGDRKYPDIPLL